MNQLLGHALDSRLQVLFEHAGILILGLGLGGERPLFGQSLEGGLDAFGAGGDAAGDGADEQPDTAQRALGGLFVHGLGHALTVKACLACAWLFGFDLVADKRGVLSGSVELPELGVAHVGRGFLLGLVQLGGDLVEAGRLHAVPCGLGVHVHLAEVYRSIRLA